MWIKKPGKINENLDFLGTFKNCLYLLKGNDYMIIGGGMATAAPALDKQLSSILTEPERLKYLIILHSHFDHCGAVPYLKRKFPNMQILASAYTAEVFAKEKVINSINSYNKRMIDKLGLQDEYEKLDLKFDGITVDRLVKENDMIDLSGGIKAFVIEVPGHTKCSLALYIPALKALFPSDSLPIPFECKGQLYYFTSPQYSFTAYKESLSKLAKYEVDICAFEHQGVFIDKDAVNVLNEGKMEVARYEKKIIDMFARTSDLDELAEEYATEAAEIYKLDFLDRDTMIAINRAEIRSVLRDAGLIE